MDTMTYVVVSGWGRMYFTPSFAFAFASATMMALIAAFLVQLGQGGTVALAGFMETAMPVAPIAFFAIFMAWPLGVFFRRLKGWWRRKAAGV